MRRATPAAEGMDATTLAQGVRRLAANHALFSVLIVRHDRLVFERYLNGSRRSDSNNIHSASKSILEALIQIAVQRGSIGSIDDTVASYLPQDFVGASAEKRSITLRDLMTMSSGLAWQEDHTEYTAVQRSPDWVKAILTRKMRSEPGSHFVYSTGDTHVLSAVLQAATGMSTCAFAERYLFDPIGVTPEHWGRDPQGVYSGGYNLYLTPREMVAFGMVFAAGGIWQGHRVVPSSAIDLADTKVWTVDPTFSYATGWWMRTVDGHGMYFAWGYGGQFIYVIPDLDIVFVTSEDTADGHQLHEINSGRFIQNYLIPAVQR